MTQQNSGNVFEKVYTILENYGNGLKILDVGASEEFLMEINMKRYGCGYEKIKNKDIKFKKVDLNKQKLPYKNNMFNVVTCLETIEHIENPYELIRELHRVVKKNGIVIISTPNIQSWYYRFYYLLTSKFIGFEIKDGYTLDHISPINFELFKSFVKPYFEIEGITSNRSIIPIIKLPLPFNGITFGDSLIIKLRKK